MDDKIELPSDIEASMDSGEDTPMLPVEGGAEWARGGGVSTLDPGDDTLFEEPS